MGPIERLIFELGEQGHSLARPLSKDEVPELIRSLQRRWDKENDFLDLSPDSLHSLEDALISLNRSIGSIQDAMSEEELLRLIREITAYLGEILVRHAGGRWDEKIYPLWATQIIIDGPWKVKKDRKFVSERPTHFMIGSTAAWALDTIIEGKEPRLYRTYSQAKKKRLKEEL